VFIVVEASLRENLTEPMMKVLEMDAFQSATLNTNSVPIFTIFIVFLITKTPLESLGARLGAYPGESIDTKPIHWFRWRKKLKIHRDAKLPLRASSSLRLNFASSLWFQHWRARDTFACELVLLWARDCWQSCDTFSFLKTAIWSTALLSVQQPRSQSGIPLTVRKHYNLTWLTMQLSLTWKLCRARWMFRIWLRRHGPLSIIEQISFELRRGKTWNQLLTDRAVRAQRWGQFADEHQDSKAIQHNSIWSW
jgi:hypothetical protein